MSIRISRRIHLKCIIHFIADRNGLIVVARIISLFSPKHVSVADVIFITEDRPHETFRREGSDLHMTVDIFLREALTGTVVTVNTLDDRTLRIPLTSVITYVSIVSIPDPVFLYFSSLFHSLNNYFTFHRIDPTNKCNC